MWLTKLGLFASVSGLAIASGLNNWNYASSAGNIGGLIAISADAFKFFAPQQIANLINQDRWISAFATIAVWACAVSFSLVAAISASSHQRAKLEAKQPIIQLGQTANAQRRAIRLAMAKIEAIKGIRSNNSVCGFDGQSINPNGKTTRKFCPKWLTLRQELKAIPEDKPKTAKLSGKTVEANAIADFAKLVGIKNLTPQIATLLMVYLWVAMVEFGSSLGGLAIQTRKDK